ncbi:hypothetical protein HN903_04575 [archaeon]|jgi:hypothetical protein|nr:hypothetical protein [archaeon]MBT7129003.1 hypothetical protein [archaeon]
MVLDIVGYVGGFFLKHKETIGLFLLPGGLLFCTVGFFARKGGYSRGRFL